MTLIRRDRGAELERLLRVERVLGHQHPDGYAARVIAHMDAVEDAGGPDAPASSSVDAIIGMHEEAIDGGAWGIVAAVHLDTEVLAGATDPHVADQVDVLLDDATVAFARAEEALRAALRLLGHERVRPDG